MHELDHGTDELEPPPLVMGCILACHQCLTIARLLTAEQFTRGRDEHKSIGEHLRHCVEHFQSFFAGIGTSRIDYDKRDRNPDIEQFPARFVEVMDDIVRQLRTLDDSSLMMPLELRTICGPGGERADVPSTLGRELAFLCTHVIHHLAIVKIIAKTMDVALPEGFGMAYSTSIHRAGASAATVGETNVSSCAL